MTKDFVRVGTVQALASWQLKSCAGRPRPLAILPRRIRAETAIATGGSKAKGTDASGKPMDEHVRWTDTWVKMPSGKWQCVASHVSPVKT